MSIRVFLFIDHKRIHIKGYKSKYPCVGTLPDVSARFGQKFLGIVDYILVIVNYFRPSSEHSRLFCPRSFTSCVVTPNSRLSEKGIVDYFCLLECLDNFNSDIVNYIKRDSRPSAVRANR